MAYLIAVGSNQPLLGAIKIESAKMDGGQTDATSVKVRRRDMAGNTWTTITTFAISSADGFDFTFLDRNVLSGHTYRYEIIPMVATEEQSAVVINVRCLYDAIFVSDSSGDFIAPFNISYKANKNIPTSYVHPLASKYPHAVRNSLANYFSGSVEGMFIPFDIKSYSTPILNNSDLLFIGDDADGFDIVDGDLIYTGVNTYSISDSQLFFEQNGMPNIEEANVYKDATIEMLSNGLVKTLRTYDGHGWLVNIDGEPSRNTDGFYNADTISFNWTEIGVFPTTGVVML